MAYVLTSRRPSNRLLGRPVEVDWQQPLARGLMSLFVPGVPVDLAHPLRSPWYTYTASLGGGPGGPALNQNNEGTGFVRATGRLAYYDFGAANTILWFGNVPPAVSRYRHLLGKRGTGAGIPTMLIGIDNAFGSSDYVYYHLNTNASDINPANDPVIVPSTMVWGRNTVLSADFNGDTGNFSAYLNGRNTYTFASGGTSLLNTGTGPDEGSWWPVLIHPGLYYLSVAWRRALSADEHLTIARNPYQILKLARQLIYSLPSVTVPTLSNATVTTVGSTTATPRVTLTF